VLSSRFLFGVVSFY